MGNVSVHGAGGVTAVNGNAGAIQIGGRNLIKLDSLEQKNCIGTIQSTDNIQFTSVTSEAISGIKVNNTYEPGTYVFTLKYTSGNNSIYILCSEQLPGFMENEFYDSIYGARYYRAFSLSSGAIHFVFEAKTTFSIGIIVHDIGTMSGIKLEHGNVATDWTPAPEDIPSMAPVQSVNGATGAVQLGGRNLFGFNKGIYTLYGECKYDHDINGVQITKLGSAGTLYGIRYGNLGFDGVNGWYTASGEIYSASSIRVLFSICDGGFESFDVTSAPKKFIYCTYVSEYYGEPGDVLYNGFFNVYSDVAGENIYIKNLKIERGNVATDWSLAPEDILSRLAALEAAAGITYEPPVYDGPEIMDEPMGGDRNEAVR